MEQLYWDENLLAGQIGDLFGMTKKQVYGRVSKYGLQLRNKSFFVFVEAFQEAKKGEDK